MQFEKNLILLRKKKNLSQEGLADLINVSRQTIYTWEAGINYPTIVMLKKLADALDVKTDDLLNGFKINKLPKSFSSFNLTIIKKHEGEIDYKELPNNFIKLEPQEEVSFALYEKNKDKYKQIASRYLEVKDKVVVHDIPGYQVEVKQYNDDSSLYDIYTQYVSINENGVAWIGQEYYQDGVLHIETYKDKCFLKEWGYDKKFIYFKTKFDNAYDCIFEFEGKKQNAIVISYFDPDGSNDLEMAYFEVVLSKDFESIAWRRYKKKQYKEKRYITNEEKIINDVVYDFDLYAITSRL